MLGIFQRSKNKKLEMLGEQAGQWYKACMSPVDESDLESLRARTGSILFFSGSINYLCELYGIDDKTFAYLSYELLESMGFSGKNVPLIVSNFYAHPITSAFALQANALGKGLIREFIEGKKPDAHLNYSKLIKQWNSEPDIKPDEVWLFE